MRNNVLIYVPEGLVKEDVIMTVREVLENAQIQIVQSAQALCETLSVHKGWAWAVVAAPKEELADPQVRRAFAENEALPVVLSTDTPDPADSGWIYLEKPFDTEMLRAALERTRPY